MNRSLLTCLAAMLVVAPAMAQTPIDFEDFAPGTAITNQYPGVTFSVPGGGLGITPTLAQTVAGSGQYNSTHSPTRYVRGIISGGDVPVVLQLDFAQNQRRVSFYTGAPLNVPLTVTVNAFDGAGAPIASLTRNIAIAAGSTGSIDQAVSLISTSANIRRVVVYTNNIGTARPVIDDLAFCTELNAEDPSVSLTAPADLSCVCPGSTISFAGTLDAGLCGSHASDLLQYRSIDAVTWSTIVGPFTILPGGGDSFAGNLYSWSVPATLPGGWYYFRAKMYNDAGRSESDVVILYVDTFPPAISFTPASPAIVRSTVCLIGQITDQCALNYAIEYRPAGAGAFTVVPHVAEPFPSIGRWPTAGLPDGDYDFRVTATDGCGNSSSINNRYIVDNTPPVARITNINPCSRVSGVVAVKGTISDTHLAGWSLQYTGGDADGWVTIATGTGPIGPDGVIANWDTAGFRNCGYTLRLRASDSADNNCGSGGNVSEDLVSVLAGCSADFNTNGIVSVQDIFDFLAAWFAGCS